MNASHSTGFLKDKAKVDSFVQLVDPLVRALDGITGEKVSMRVDLDCTDGKKALGIYTHKKLSVAVGVCIAAFARAVLEGSTKPGVWYPEEDGGIRVEDREKLLERACKGTINYIMNKSVPTFRRYPTLDSLLLFVHQRCIKN
ncbi:hypothetical protein R1flu_022686 [Riccia fluitans]|uniref:Uncharacterized protein n=1 Tax=Riccia fluitans TaxID=41844 RepID=A0ABD1XQD6_9MARC